MAIKRTGWHRAGDDPAWFVRDGAMIGVVQHESEHKFAPAFVSDGLPGGNLSVYEWSDLQSAIRAAEKSEMVLVS